MELKLKLVTTSPGGWVVVGGWTKTKLMLFSTQVEVLVELKLELSLAIKMLSPPQIGLSCVALLTAVLEKKPWNYFSLFQTERCFL